MTSPGSQRILVVDDEAPNRLFIARLLEREGWSVTQAAGGAEALRLAEKETFDLALVDVMMPEMNGFDVCARLKAQPHSAEWPVIMVTALTSVEDVEQSFVRGAFDYIRKPFNPRELVARARNALALRASTAELRAWQRRVSRELRLAGEVQQALFAAPPVRAAGWELRAVYGPASEVGGDFLEIGRLPDGRLAVAVGDVSGHGVAPALIAALLKATLNELLREFHAAGPARVARELETRFRRFITAPELYATLLLGMEEPDRRAWRFVSCGHPPPVRWGIGGAAVAREFETRGMTPIGFGGPEFAAAPPAEVEVTLTLAPGERLLLYTDGLSEATGPDGREFGEEGVVALLQALPPEEAALHPPRAVRRAAERAGVRFGADDVTLLTIRAAAADADVWRRETLPARPAVVAAAAEIAGRLRAAGWDDEAAGAVELLAVEHGMNVLDHAGAPSDAPLRWRLEQPEADYAILSCADRGRDWEPPAAPESGAPDAERGRGWLLIAGIAADRERWRLNGENVHRFLVRRRAGDAPAAPSSAHADPQPPTGKPSMSATFTREGTIGFMQAPESLTAVNSETFREQAAAWLKENDGLTRLIADCSGLQMLDSTGLGSLVALQRQLNERGIEFRLAALQTKPRLVMEITRAHQIFNIFPTPAAAAG